jgi:hypothetical protein
MDFYSTISKKKTDNALSRNTKYFGLHVEINLGETSNGISKVDCPINLNRISTHTRTSLRRWSNHFFATHVREYGRELHRVFWARSKNREQFYHLEYFTITGTWIL